jgi:hypothetical protein
MALDRTARCVHRSSRRGKVGLQGAVGGQAASDMVTMRFVGRHNANSYDETYGRPTLDRNRFHGE